MKKILLAGGIILMTATSIFARSAISRERKETRIEKREARKEIRHERRLEDRNEVSDFTRNQFAIDFPGAKDVQFVKTKDFDEVYFMSGKKSMKAYYDITSNLVGTTRRKTFSDLPENAQKKILEKYAGYSIAGVIKYDDNQANDTDMVMYGVPFEDADNYFVELKNKSKAIVLEVTMLGDVSFFTAMK